VLGLALVLSYDADCGKRPTSGPADGMRAVLAYCYGGPEVLTIETVGKPEPGEHDVLVRVHAASVNPLDWHYMRGSPYVMRLQTGIGRPDEARAGVDFSGVVEAVGPGVTRFAPGDAVFGGAGGAFAEYVLIPESFAIVTKPGNVGFEAAAGVPIAAITALQAVRDKGRVGAGDRVLINGASGGVGTFAVQIAKSLGADVTGVSSARNHELVLGLGADRMIDYRTEDYTDGETRYDVIVDMVGNHSIGANREVLADGGRFVIVGGARGDWIAPFVNPVRAMLASSDTGQTFSPMLASMNRDDLETLAGLLADGTVTTVIDREYELDEIAEALQHSESGRARGKIIVRIRD
jgi:NADPH:quinone reductase-like Zn-dependent oxidoreductase